MAKRYIESQVIAGDPIRVGRDQVVPLMRSIRARPFGFPAGLVWHRPVAVMIRDEDGKESLLSIRDPTRSSQILLLAAGFVGSLLLWRLLGGRKSE